MGKIVVVHEQDVPIKEGSRPIVKDGVKRTSHTRFPIVKHNPGPWMGRVTYDPGMRQEAHWHAANEIVYIISGDLTVGETTYGPGSAIAIEAETSYGPLIAGPQGVDFILIMDRDPQASYAPGTRERLKANS